MRALGVLSLLTRLDNSRVGQTVTWLIAMSLVPVLIVGVILRAVFS